MKILKYLWENSYYAKIKHILAIVAFQEKPTIDWIIIFKINLYKDWIDSPFISSPQTKDTDSHDYD